MLIRETCVICDADGLEALTSCQNVPMYIGPAFDDADEFADQHWSICKRCGGVQLTEVVAPDILYAHSHTPGTVGDTWNRHHEEFADFVLRNGAAVILEIGAGNMNLANAISTKRQFAGDYFVMDPNVDESNSPAGTVIFRRMWTHEIDSEDVPRVDTIIHSHTMEHFYWPNKDLKAMAGILSIGQLMCLSVPVIDRFIRLGWTNGINFEHSYLTTITNIRYMVEAAGFEIIEQYWFSDYNVFISARKVENPKFPVIANEYEKNQKLFHTYMSNLDDDVKFIESRLNEMTGPKFIFGAHIFTQTLVSRGLNESMFLNVLDNDPTKQGRRLYGTSLKIESPEILRNLKNPIVVVRAAQYTSEIVRGIRQINLKVIII